MDTIYYKFTNSGVAYQSALDAGFIVSGENELIFNQFANDYAIDVIGKIKEDEDFYHWNLRVLSDSFVIPSGLEEFRIEAPLNPIRVFL
jgi:hypothetical protein